MENLTFLGGILSMIIAIAAAIAAKRSAEAAETQAGTARDQATSAETSAKAAVDQAESARKSARVSEAALRTERLRIYQRAKQLLREIERSVHGAFTQSLWGGVSEQAAAHCNIAAKRLDELAHLPVEPNAPFTREVGEVSDQCFTLFKALEEANFLIWDKDHIRAQVILLQNDVSNRLLANVALFDATIAADD